MMAGHRVIIEDVTKHAPYARDLAVAAATGYRGVSCTPSRERGTGLPLGLLTTLFREPFRPDEARLRLSDLFAAQASRYRKFTPRTAELARKRAILPPGT